jgi:hypothetical protein
MWQVIESQEDYLKAAKIIVESNPEYVDVSSYGLYMGITSAGKDSATWLNGQYTKNTRRIMNAIPDGTPVRMLIGMAGKSECTPGCKHCREALEKKIKYLYYHVKLLPHFNIKVVAEHHTKLFISERYALVGGMNFTDSGWTDMDLLTDEVDVIRRIRAVFERQYSAAKDLFNKDTIDPVSDIFQEMINEHRI